MLGISATNLNAILMSTGEPVFLDGGEYKAWLIASLAPIASISIKLIPMGFDIPQHRRLFQKALYWLTAMAIFLWVYLVADTFQGMGQDIDIGMLLDDSEDTSTSQLYVWTQLLVEILMVTPVAM